jgi:hypothetical protein
LARPHVADRPQVLKAELRVTIVFLHPSVNQTRSQPEGSTA